MYFVVVFVRHSTHVITTIFISLELIFNWDQLEADHICIHINVRLARQQQNKLVDLNQIQSFFREISKELLPLHVSFL